MHDVWNAVTGRRVYWQHQWFLIPRPGTVQFCPKSRAVALQLVSRASRFLKRKTSWLARLPCNLDMRLVYVHILCESSKRLTACFIQMPYSLNTYSSWLYMYTYYYKNYETHVHACISDRISWQEI